MLAAMESPSLRLATVLLGEPVRDWVVARRTAGASWPTIAEALALATNGQVSLSKEYLRQRYAAAAREAVEPAAAPGEQVAS